MPSVRGPRSAVCVSTTENGAVLNSMASTFADDCGGINADAVLTMMTNIYGTLLISIEFFFFLCIIFSQF